MIPLKQAIKKSEFKWRLLLDSDYVDKKDYPELANLLYGCGFCERHKRQVMAQNVETMTADCGKCELRKYAGKCSNSGSVFSRYLSAVICKDTESRVAHARTMLGFINIVKQKYCK